MLASERDQSLIDNCLKGSSEAFEELVRPYQDRLYNLLCRLARRRDDANELYQEVLLRVFRGLKTYQGDAAFFTWMYRIALNVVLTSRKRKRLPEVSASDAGENSHPLERPDTSRDSQPDAGIETAERRVMVEAALADIPDLFRAVLVLKDVEGFRYEEIAELLDVPIGTVRSRLHRARSELRERLRPMMEKGML